MVLKGTLLPWQGGGGWWGRVGGRPKFCYFSVIKCLETVLLFNCFLLPFLDGYEV